MLYRIENTKRDRILGCYEAKSPEMALDALARDCGYCRPFDMPSIKNGEVIAYPMSMKQDEILDLIRISQEVVAEALGAHAAGNTPESLPQNLINAFEQGRSGSLDKKEA